MGIRNTKIWYDRRSRKLKNKKKKKGRKYVGSNFNSVYKDDENEQYDYIGEYRATAPKVFSFVDNLEETTEMFGKLLDAIKNGTYRKRFFFDASIVEDVTTDVVLYIIAVIKNIKINRLRQYTFAGNLPQNNEAARVYNESGLYKYVRSKKQELPANNSKMQIASGKKTDGVLASQICKFVMEKFGITQRNTQYVYKTIIEMMSNAVHHAYDNTQEEIMYPCWYMYAEYSENKIRLIFLDTGLGIATTVKKKYFFEKYIKKDSELIESAFMGEFRTETQKEHRGLGLPALKEYAEKGYFKSFFVLSGKGGYKYQGNGMFSRLDIENKIYGTIYVIDLEK